MGAVDPAQKLIGSMIIIYAGSLDEARKIAESDVYWIRDVVRCSLCRLVCIFMLFFQWDKERTTITPFLSANLNSD